jgi:hypothetical protein
MSVHIQDAWGSQLRINISSGSFINEYGKARTEKDFHFVKPNHKMFNLQKSKEVNKQKPGNSKHKLLNFGNKPQTPAPETLHSSNKEGNKKANYKLALSHLADKDNSTKPGLSNCITDHKSVT